MSPYTSAAADMQMLARQATQNLYPAPKLMNEAVTTPRKINLHDCMERFHMELNRCSELTDELEKALSPILDNNHPSPTPPEKYDACPPVIDSALSAIQKAHLLNYRLNGIIQRLSL